MVTVPAAVQRAVVIGVRLLVRLHGQVGRAHDALPQVVDAVQVVRVVVAGEMLRRIGDQAGVYAGHHKLGEGVSRDRGGGSGEWKRADVRDSAAGASWWW